MIKSAKVNEAARGAEEACHIPMDKLEFLKVEDNQLLKEGCPLTWCSTLVN